ncbi:superoxide dismutase [soil metagenome]
MKHNQSKSRRNFIKNTAAGTAAIGLGLAGLQSFAFDKNTDQVLFDGFSTGFDQQPLPYKYNDLEDVIDTMTMEIHYTKHAAGYSKNLKDAAKAEGAESKTVEELLAAISKYSPKMHNNAGGHYNHEMFWQCMRPKSANNAATGKLLAAIISSFGSFAAFKEKFTEAGKSRFGSGWAWLYADAKKDLKIGSTANQDNPLMDTSDIKGMPLLGLDVWEHAYYLKYQNKRPDYIENWWNVVNWNYVQQRFEKL